MMFTCLIVDDEPVAREIMTMYCSQVPDLRVVAACGNALQAKKTLQQEKTDILFLDIQMPVLDGLSFLRTLRQAPQVIFTTAYPDFAVDAFELAACDYLVKPFSLERFIIAVDRATERLLPGSAERGSVRHPGYDTFFIKTSGRINKLHFGDILFAEAQGNYTKIVMTDTILLPNISFSEMVSLLPADYFVM